MYLPPGMNAVVQHKLNPQAYRDLVLSAKRFDSATDGYKNGFVDHIYPEEEILSKTIELGLKLSNYGVDKLNHKKIKKEANKNAINACLNL